MILKINFNYSGFPNCVKGIGPDRRGASKAGAASRKSHREKREGREQAQDSLLQCFAYRAGSRDSPFAIFASRILRQRGTPILFRMPEGRTGSP
jgi:hypothetical protein